MRKFMPEKIVTLCYLFRFFVYTLGCYCLGHSFPSRRDRYTPLSVSFLAFERIYVPQVDFSLDRIWMVTMQHVATLAILQSCSNKQRRMIR